MFFLESFRLSFNHIALKTTCCLVVLLSFSWAFRLRFQLRRRAFRYIFARCVITSLAKDAAPIPNAKVLLKKH